MCNAGRSTSRGQGPEGQAGAPRAAPRPSGQAGMSCFFFFSQHPLDVFSTCSVHAHGQFATQTLKKCPGGNWAPLPKDLAVPAVLWAQRGRGSSRMTRSIAAQRGQNFLTTVINNSSTHLCAIQFSFLHLHHSTEDMAFVTQIHHVSQGGEEGKKGVLSLRSGSRKKGRKKVMEIEVHNPPAKGNFWVHTARTAQRWAQVWTSQSRQWTHHRQHHGAEELCSLSAPNTTLMPKVHWPRQKAELVISLGLHINPSSEKLTFSQGLKYPSCLISEMFTLQNTVMHRWRDSCSHISCGNWFLWDLLPVGLILLQIFCKRNLPDSSAQHFADTMLKGTGIMNFMPEGY